MFARTFIAAVLLPAAAFPMAAKELKVLMIGNSFSICVGRNLPQIVGKDADNKLVLTSAYIGGCTFDRHYNYLATAEKKPEFAPYRITKWDSEKNPAKGNI